MSDLYSAICYMAGRCNGASTKDNVGFNGYDAGYGKRLSYMPESEWTEKDKYNAWKMLKKYRGQLLAGGIDYSQIPEQSNGFARSEKLIGVLASGEFVVVFPYNPALVAEVKALPQRRFDGDGKRWVVAPVAANIPALWTFIQAHPEFEVTQTVLDKMAEIDAVSEPAPAQPEQPKFDGVLSLDDKKVVVTFNAIPDQVTRDWMKKIPGWKFEGATKQWSFPAGAALAIAQHFNNHDGAAMILEDASRDADNAVKEVDQTKEKLHAAIDVNAPLPNGRTLYGHQKEGVNFMLNTHKLILGDDMGLGKTLQALLVAKAWKQAFDYPAFVICPAGLKDNWFKEAAMVQTPIEVYSWAKMPQVPDKPFVLICDECFPAGTKVNTLNGLLDIDFVVENRMDVPILSLNLNNGAVEYKRILRWVKKPYSGAMIKIGLSDKSFECTPNHKIFVEGRGYVRADEIKPGMQLRNLREDNPHNQEKKTKEILLPGVSGHSNALGKKDNLPFLRCRVSLPEKFKKHVLLQEMFKQCNKENKCGICRNGENVFWSKGEEEAGRVNAYEGKQSHVESCCAGENANFAFGENISGKGWQWAIDRTTKEAFCVSGSSNAGYVGNGTRYSYSEGEGRFRVSTDSLQGGYRNGIFEDRGRGGRENAQNKEMEVFGQAEDFRFECSRVVSVEVHERRCYDENGSGNESNLFVYNLEIEDNHNYFANGVLVSNCHYAQNAKSARGKNFLALATSENCKAVIAATGTPMKNGRPVNLWPLLRAVGADFAMDKKGYERRYCAAGPTRFSQWDTSGAAHLDELHVKCKPFMLRRLKKDCLDLPGKVRTMRAAELSGEAQGIYDAAFSAMREDYLNRLKIAEENKKVITARYLAAEIDADEYKELLDKELSSEGEQLVMLTHLRRAMSIAKVETALEVAGDVLEEGRSVVIFTDFVESAQQIAQALKGYGVELLTGDVTGKDAEAGVSKRQAMVDRFQAGKSRIFVSTIKAGGVGITLTAASDVILVDRPWTPGDAEQAEDRCNRIGQSVMVNCQWIQAGDIDVKVDEILIQKQERIDAVMEGTRKTMRATGGSITGKAIGMLFEMFDNKQSKGKK